MNQYGDLMLEHLLRYTDLFVLSLDVVDLARLRAVSRKFRYVVSKTYIWPGLTWKASAFVFRALEWTFPTRAIAVPIYIRALDYFIFKDDEVRFNRLLYRGADNWANTPDMRGFVHNLARFAAKNRGYTLSRVVDKSQIGARLRVAEILQHMCEYHRSEICGYIADGMVLIATLMGCS